MVYDRAPHHVGVHIDGRGGAEVPGPHEVHRLRVVQRVLRSARPNTCQGLPKLQGCRLHACITGRVMASTGPTSTSTRSASSGTRVWRQAETIIDGVAPWQEFLRSAPTCNVAPLISPGATAHGVQQAGDPGSASQGIPKGAPGIGVR